MTLRSNGTRPCENKIPLRQVELPVGHGAMPLGRLASGVTPPVRLFRRTEGSHKGKKGVEEGVWGGF